MPRKLKQKQALGSGSRLGRYSIVAELGAGAMGVVYRARDTGLGRDVAVKVLAPSLSGDPEAVHRFHLEACAASALNHPNVLTIFDAGTHDGAPYLVMELLVGETLGDRIRRGKLPPATALDFAAQIAGGLGTAHEKGIVHRDLKPENLFVTSKGIKILDFGIAKVLPDAKFLPARFDGNPAVETIQGSILGTPAYMSPEQVKGHPADQRCDVFAFGSILYEMLSGRRAFSGETPFAIANAIATSEPPPLEDVPRALDQIVRRCLRKKPEERFASGTDLERALKQLQPGNGADFATEAVAVSAQSAAASQPREGTLVRPHPTKPRPPLAPFIAVAAVVLVASILYWRWVRGPGDGPGPRPVPPQQITYQRGTVWSARFAADGESIVYSAAWDGKADQTQIVVPGNPAARSLDLPPARVLSISSSKEAAILLDVRAGSLDYMPTGTLARVPLAGGAPRELLEDVLCADWDAKGEELAVVHAVNGKARVEYPPGKVLYASDGWISHLRVSPQGKIAFIEHPFFGDTRGVVMLIDAAGKPVALTKDLGSVMGLAWSSAGSEIWFTGGDTAQSAALQAVTPDGSPRLIQQIAGSLVLHDVARDGRVLLARESWRHLMRGGVPGKAEEQGFSWQDYSIARELSADGRKLLFMEAGQGGGQLFGAWVSPLDHWAPVRLGNGYALSMTPDGKSALLASVLAPSELNVVPTGPGQPRKLALPVAQIAGAHWFPGGKDVLVTARERNGGPLRIYVVDALTARLRPLSETGVPGQELLSRPISPDGGRVLVVRSDGFFIYRADGEGKPEPVEGLEPGQIPVGWYPDGTSLLVRRPGLPSRIARLDLARPRLVAARRLTQAPRQQPWRELRPPDPAGVTDIPWVYVASTPAGEVYVYTYQQILSDLYLYRGLQ